ncbi:hypothetical protein DESAMIL20_2026 [Desulfurella amilsii]|uniref:Uncharacterized protein n=1 Tax=Desulfurella amilsii TaxID=1562698 RepID=A0A1X4XU90_9BACT|nr:hypothetical protein DESAMIL20_2026 [Desulfurella amilsii]
MFALSILFETSAYSANGYMLGSIKRTLKLEFGGKFILAILACNIKYAVFGLTFESK